MSTKKICVVTGGRAEYGLLVPVMQAIQQAPELTLQLVVGGMHLSTEFGHSVDQILADGFVIDEKIEHLLSVDSPSGVAKSSGLATLLLSEAFSRLQPDIVLLLGDRYEIHAAATTAVLMNIPLAHIHGGELTLGAVDEQLRHAISKMAYWHFVATAEYRQRVIQLGEHPERVFVSGAPAIDRIQQMSLLAKPELENALDWPINAPCALFSYHPETLSQRDSGQDMNAILQQIEDSGLSVLFTYANADSGGRAINRQLETFANTNRQRYRVVKNLGQLRYFSAMTHLNLLIGNTSSGIIEAASFHLPVINLGKRQAGRLQSGNVINSEISNLTLAIKQALSPDFIAQCRQVVNRYGNGQAANVIVKVLQQQSADIVKAFYDLDASAS